MGAHIPAGIFNEGTASLLCYTSEMGLSLGSKTHLYAEKENSELETQSVIKVRRVHNR